MAFEFFFCIVDVPSKVVHRLAVIVSDNGAKVSECKHRIDADGEGGFREGRKDFASWMSLSDKAKEKDSGILALHFDAI